jgi:hypothetical protein
MTDEQRQAMAAFRPPARVNTPEGAGRVITQPTIGADASVCFGVRLDSGPAIIAKHWSTTLVDDYVNYDAIRESTDDELREIIAEGGPAAAVDAAAAELRRRTCPPAGARVRLLRDVDRYPHFIAPAGALGEVVDVGDPNLFAVRLDQPLPGAETWSNEVHWILDAGENPAGDVEVLP